jgi:hypothetical protein
MPDTVARNKLHIATRDMSTLHKTGNARVNVTLRRVRVTIVAVEKE